MVNTSPDDLYVPTGGTTIGQLEARIGAVSTSVQTALSRGAIARVANQTERDARFPAGTRAQGDRVYRSDSGWEEVWLNAYNASTNPGGATVAGWYPTAGKLPWTRHTRTGGASITSTAASFAFSSASGYGPSFSSTRTTILHPGRYQLTANITAGNGGGAEIFAEIRRNNGAGGVAAGAARQEGANNFNMISLAAIENLAAADYIEFVVWGSTSLATGNFIARMDIQYIGPA